MSNNHTVLAEGGKIVRLWLEGHTTKTISKQTGASLSVVYCWIHRWQETGTIRSRPYRRRLKKILWFEYRGLIMARMFNTSLTSTSMIRVPLTFPSASASQFSSSEQRYMTSETSSFNIPTPFYTHNGHPFERYHISSITQQHYPQPT